MATLAINNIKHDLGLNMYDAVYLYIVAIPQQVFRTNCLDNILLNMRLPICFQLRSSPADRNLLYLEDVDSEPPTLPAAACMY